MLDIKSGHHLLYDDHFHNAIFISCYLRYFTQPKPIRPRSVSIF